MLPTLKRGNLDTCNPKEKRHAFQMMSLDRLYRVLVADDEPEFRSWLKSVLNDSGDFRLVGEASNGTEAFELIPLLLPDLVIADMYMPEADGLEVVRYVQRYFSGIKAILVSAYEERLYERLAREEGALAFIPKARLSLDALRRALKGGGEP
jgi:two-component system response regulator YesN